MKIIIFGNITKVRLKYLIFGMFVVVNLDQSRCREGSTMTVSVHKKEFPTKTHSRRVKACLMTSVSDFFEASSQLKGKMLFFETLPFYNQI